ncbi:MAG: hypothetical protein KC464_04895, partial [Myxococcales bacterium]|nr:hypothetical protein [Myxococcales bacterium]
MYELAFNNNGERFELPTAAEFWRPRRVRDRGLEVVYKKDGIVPLIVSIDTTADEFRGEVSNTPGKYRLDALDAHHQPLDGVPAAYVVIPRGEPAPSPTSEAPAAAAPAVAAPGRQETGYSETATLLSEVVRVNAEMTRAMAERFSSVMEAAAHLLRAADGAGLPARTPLEPRNSGALATPPVRDDEETADGEDDGGDDDEATMIEKIESVTRNVADAAQALSPLAMMLVGKRALRNASSKHDGSDAGAARARTGPRMARPAPDAAPRESTSAEGPAVEPTEAAGPGESKEDCGAGDDVAPTPAMMAHLVAIRG